VNDQQESTRICKRRRRARITRINANGFAVVNRQIVKTDFEMIRVNWRDSQAKKSLSIDVNFRFRPLKKTSKKIKKKACQPLTRSSKRGVDATSMSGRAFKKTLKKVKKKLVSAAEI
jgi:hypothetical protein